MTVSPTVISTPASINFPYNSFENLLCSTVGGLYPGGNVSLRYILFNPGPFSDVPSNDQLDTSHHLEESSGPAAFESAPNFSAVPPGPYIIEQGIDNPSQNCLAFVTNSATFDQMGTPQLKNVSRRCSKYSISFPWMEILLGRC